jgi:hypothetical protein
LSFYLLTPEAVEECAAREVMAKTGLYVQVWHTASRPRQILLYLRDLKNSNGCATLAIGLGPIIVN